MRYVLSATVAILALGAIAPASEAADVAPYMPPPPPPPQIGPPPPPPPPIFPGIPCWTGFYIGANLGGAWIGEDFVDANGNSFSLNNSGFIGGGQLGYNYQFGNVVLGAEWMFDGLSLNLPAVNGNAIAASANAKWITTFAARFGWGWDRWLVYGKAGAGLVGSDVTIANPTTGASVTTSNDNGGLLVGVGGEWAFAPNWTIKLEYDFLALSNTSPTIAGAVVTDNSGGSGRNLQMFTVGVNYLFNWGPPFLFNGHY
jgi:outer membrane immunogenic protein